MQQSRSKSYENELASGVSDALAELETQAAHLGADAVVGGSAINPSHPVNRPRASRAQLTRRPL